jgi:hypothetical protein
MPSIGLRIELILARVPQALHPGIVNPTVFSAARAVCCTPGNHANSAINRIARMIAFLLMFYSFVLFKSSMTLPASSFPSRERERTY